MDASLKPLSMIYNQQSGFHASQNDEIYEQLITLWSDAGYEIQVFDLSNTPDLAVLMQRILQRHHQYVDLGVIVAAGGDGTLNAVAAHLLGQNIPLGILPLGTFNYVARVLEIPLDLLEAAKVIVSGQVRASHVGRINDQIYLNNACFGLYPLFIQKREWYNQHFGRFTLHAYTSALDVLIRDRKELSIEIEIDQQRYPVNTPLLFFGNNQLQLEQLRLHIAQSAAQGEVAGVLLARADQATIFKTLLQLIRGNLEHAEHVHSFSGQQVCIYSKKSQMTVAIDGELVKIKMPIHIRVEQNALNIQVPYAAPFV